MNTIKVLVAPAEHSFREFTFEGISYFKNVDSDEYTVITPTFYRQYVFGVFREHTHFIITTSLDSSMVVKPHDLLWKVLSEHNWVEIDEQTALDAIQAGLLKGLNQLREATI